MFKPGDSGADRVNYTHTFVSKDSACRASWHVALDDMKISATNRCFIDLDDCISRRSDFRFGAVLERNFTGTEIGECFHAESPIGIKSDFCPANRTHPMMSNG